MYIYKYKHIYIYKTNKKIYIYTYTSLPPMAGGNETSPGMRIHQKQPRASPRAKYKWWSLYIYSYHHICLLPYRITCAYIYTHTRSYTDINFFEAYPHKMDKHLYGFPLALWVYIYKVFKCINVILAGPMLTHDTILNHFLGAHILLSFLILSQVLQPRRGKPKWRPTPRAKQRRRLERQQRRKLQQLQQLSWKTRSFLRSGQRLRMTRKWNPMTLTKMIRRKWF